MTSIALKFTLNYLYHTTQSGFAKIMVEFPEPPDGSEDPEPISAPIDTYTFILLLAALILATYVIVKLERSVRSLPNLNE